MLLPDYEREPQKPYTQHLESLEREFINKTVDKISRESKLYPEFGQKRLTFAGREGRKTEEYYALVTPEPLKSPDGRIMTGESSPRVPWIEVYRVVKEKETGKWLDSKPFRISVREMSRINYQDKAAIGQIAGGELLDQDGLKDKDLAANVLLRSSVWKYGGQPP